MIKYKASERKVDLYDIGDGLTLMNIILKNEDGKMRSIDTYIGTDRNGFSCVGHTVHSAEPSGLRCVSERTLSSDSGQYHK